MKTEFLTGLGLTKEQVDAVMAENGKDINAEKDKTKAAHEQLTTLQADLKAFEGVDVNDLKGKVEKLTADLADKDKEYNAKIAEIEFTRALETTIAGAKPRNVKAVMALLDVDKLKDSKNQQTDIAAALEQVKKENEYLFEATPKITGSTPGPSGGAAGGTTATLATAAANDALRSIFGKGE